MTSNTKRPATKQTSQRAILVLCHFTLQAVFRFLVSYNDYASFQFGDYSLFLSQMRCQYFFQRSRAFNNLFLQHLNTVAACCQKSVGDNNECGFWIDGLISVQNFQNSLAGRPIWVELVLDATDMWETTPSRICAEAVFQGCNDLCTFQLDGNYFFAKRMDG